MRHFAPCADGAVCTGRGFFSAQVEQALMGAMRGQTRPAPLQGRTTPLTVLKIKRRTVPAFTDELAGRLGIEGVATAQEYRQYLLDRLTRRLRQKREDVVSDYVTKRVLENTVFSPVDRERGICAMTVAMARDQARGEVQRANAESGSGGSPVTELDILRELASVPDTATEGETLEAIAVRCEENAKLCALGMSAAARDSVEYPVESIIEELRAQAEAGGRTYEQMRASTGVIPELLVAGRYIDYFLSRITSYYSDRYTVTVVD